MFRYIAKTLYLDLANDLQFGTDGIFINLLLKHTAILGFTPFVVCPLHLKLVIMWLLLGRLICSDGMLLIWWCKLDITFSGTLVNTHRHYVFFLFFNSDCCYLSRSWHACCPQKPVCHPPQGLREGLPN